ncbi:hypothetical protein AXX17_AT3G35390 [Arabidopsis thaliana]|uniref:DUF287 domain-containing protein n=1 Tax=Arabidopsis thaliana TaxID=3702 RepID=A0A178V897_ARATH|nr:hypothetical protein AXX17_AT3G35390 [Arabidopsis thaliana]
MPLQPESFFFTPDEGEAQQQRKEMVYREPTIQAYMVLGSDFTQRPSQTDKGHKRLENKACYRSRAQKIIHGKLSAESPRITLTRHGKHIRAKFEHALGITQITSEDVRPRVPSQSVLAPSKFLRYPQSSRMIRKVSLKQRSSIGDLRINGNLPRLSLEAVYESYIKRLKEEEGECLIASIHPFTTFEDTMDEIRHLMKKRLEGTMEVDYLFPGFIVFLEVLAFECILELSKQYQECVIGANNICKEALLLDLMERVEDEDSVDLTTDAWNDRLDVQQNKIWWEDLYKLDVDSQRYREVHVPAVEQMEEPQQNVRQAEQMEEDSELLLP